MKSVLTLDLSTKNPDHLKAKIVNTIHHNQLQVVFVYCFYSWAFYLLTPVFYLWVVKEKDLTEF